MSQRYLEHPESARSARQATTFPFALDEFRHHLYVGEADLMARLPVKRQIDDEIAELEGRIDDIEHALWMTMLDIDSNSGEGVDRSAAMLELRRLRGERAELRARLDSLSRSTDDLAPTPT